MRAKLSAFVISYNRADLLESCLRAVSFADELIVIDKSSTDNSVEVAARYADHVEVVPWSPTVEETRAFAASLCQHEWILFLDDDEILSRITGPYLRSALDNPEVDIFAIPLRHYILGVHDERAYYWPEEHRRLFRRGSLEFIPTVHGGVALQTDRIVSIPTDSGVCIHHLSYRDVAGWIERTNRYTSRPDRVQVTSGEGNLIKFAHDQIEFWMGRTTDPSCDDYPAAVALLRAIYDMVDRLKAWEKARGLDGDELFRVAQQQLVPTSEDGKRRGGMIQADVAVSESSEPSVSDSRRPYWAGEHSGMKNLRDSRRDENHVETQETLVLLRATEAQLRERTEIARKSSLGLTGARNELKEATDALASTRNDLDATRATLEQTQATLEQTLVALRQTQPALEQTKASLEQTKAERDHAQAMLYETRANLDQTHADLDQTRTELLGTQVTIDQTRAELHRIRTAYDQSQSELEDTRAHLSSVELEMARLGGSARLFLRQYLPKLRKHLLP